MLDDTEAMFDDREAMFDERKAMFDFKVSVVGVDGWWVPLYYLVTSETDFSLSEAVKQSYIFRCSTSTFQ